MEVQTLKIISVAGKSALLEITYKCYTGCTDAYCYKKTTVSTKGLHTSLSVVKKRVDWLKTNTNCETICILGGEPLLHPDLPEICNYILSSGFNLEIITSGKTSKIPFEVRNLEFILELSERGLIEIQLSYHFGRNREQYIKIREAIREGYTERRSSLKKLGKYHEKMYDHMSTAVVPANLNKKEFEEFIALVLEDNGWAGDHVKYLEDMWKEYLKHFLDKSNLFSYVIHTTDDWMLFRQSIRFIGANEVFDLNGEFYLSLPEGGSCYGANATVTESSITLGALHITGVGGITFPMPQCIDMKYPLANIDIHTDPATILSVLSGSLKQIKSHVHVYNRIKAKENCGPDGQEIACTACPFDKMCTPCWQTKRPWQK